MPVRKLRSLDQSQATLWREPDSPLLWATIRGVWSLSDRLFPPRFAPGVYRHRTIEEANLETERWEAAVIAARRGA